MSSLGMGLIAAGIIVCVFLWFRYQRKPRCIHTFEGHKKWVTSVAFSPDGKLVTSGSWDETIKLWDIETRECLNTFKGHTSTVNSVAFSPDGKLMASGSDDKTIKLWDVENKEYLHTLWGMILGGMILMLIQSPLALTVN